MAKTRGRNIKPEPDPAREAIRQRLAEDRQHREAEFTARGEYWSKQADEWFAVWSQEEELREHAERGARLKTEREPPWVARQAEYEAEAEARKRAEREAKDRAEQERQAREQAEARTNRTSDHLDDLLGALQLKLYNKHFAVLGIAFGSSKDEIKRAYFRLAKLNHPDCGGDAAEFRRVNEAYGECLKIISMI